MAHGRWVWVALDGWPLELELCELGLRVRLAGCGCVVGYVLASEA
jgi:hypothetical protein